MVNSLVFTKTDTCISESAESPV